MKTKTLPPLLKHSDHQIEIRSSTGTPHAAMYYCVDCKKWVAWLSKATTEQAKQLGLLK